MANPKVNVKVKKGDISFRKGEGVMFREIIERLEGLGWQEICPLRRHWRYVKGRFTCYLDWHTGTVRFAF